MVQSSAARTHGGRARRSHGKRSTGRMLLQRTHTRVQAAARRRSGAYVVFAGTRTTTPPGRQDVTGMAGTEGRPESTTDSPALMRAHANLLGTLAIASAGQCRHARIGLGHRSDGRPGGPRRRKPSCAVLKGRTDAHTRPRAQPKELRSTRLEKLPGPSGKCKCGPRTNIYRKPAGELAKYISAQFICTWYL